MKQIVALSGSNSEKSINSVFLDYIVHFITSKPAKRLSLLNYDIPIYSIDLEEIKGIPVDIKIIKNKISESTGLIIGVNEHNSMISAYFKNIFDWLSRADRNFLAGKKILLVSTAPGTRGGAQALDYMRNTIPKFGGNVVEHFSFPCFQENFDLETNRIKHPTMEIGVKEVIASFLHQLED